MRRVHRADGQYRHGHHAGLLHARDRPRGQRRMAQAERGHSGDRYRAGRVLSWRLGDLILWIVAAIRVLPFAGQHPFFFVATPEHAGIASDRADYLHKAIV
ncbi:hypothetical protein BN2476_730003 [Paraburkholderia piptadeniae]|uniref:Uncharacterized protein n=1 Tax=Paraburkholderia piptadeniae TaxID=1701573 RepID=A0A1N7SR35_9BURK|nr:hypothetical protein BN2476_730003 [Paraburkholderia piptadeniae]